MGARLTLAQARKLGIQPANHPPELPGSRKGRKRSKSVAVLSAEQKLFLRACKAHGLPEPVEEYQFAAHLGRKWRFDWVFEGTVALEITSIERLKNDIEKHNLAGVLGYLVIRCLPEDIENGSIFPTIKAALQGDS